VADDWRTGGTGTSLIGERPRAGVKDAKRRGVKFGRKPKLTAQQIDHARKLIGKGQRREHVASLFNANRTTLYRALWLKAGGTA
jgi:DNA invertase Pin-like site-specific DNA recombinase